ncbi:MAG: hypothetical protein RLZZ428_924 [Pseudomonadota bacterium]
MKKLLLLPLILASTLVANQSGEAIFDAKCSACHPKIMPRDMQNNPMGSQKFMAMVATIKAPPLPRLVEHLQSQMSTKADFVAFVSDYITNPSLEKAKCRKGALERFGVMPAIGKAMSQEERHQVAAWMYDTHATPKMMKMEMKCAAGKCGGNN